MRKLRGYGPSLVVLGTAALVLVAGPFAVRRLTYEQTRAQVIQASARLAGNDVLEKINQAYRDIASVVEPSVVHISAQQVIRTEDGIGPASLGLSTGSGWIYDGDGHIVTNHHVIQDAERIEVQMYNGDLVEAKLVGADPSTDIAVIKVPPVRLHPATLADDLTEPVKQGDLVFAFGSPFDFRFSMSSGVVGGKGRSVGVIRDETGDRMGYQNFIQVDAAINPGNSGGPLTDYRGRVIGMNTAIATGRRSYLEEGQFSGIGLAIPMDMIRPAVTQIIRFGRVEKGRLGVKIEEITAEDQHRGFSGLGVKITRVDPDGPGVDAGLRAGDIITAVNSSTVESVAQLQSVISSMLPGETARLTLWRDDFERGGAQSMSLDVPLKKLDDLRATGDLPMDQSRESIIALGIERMSTSTRESARRHGADFLPGVLLEQLVPETELSRRLEPGSIIISVNDRSVRDVDEFLRVLRRFNFMKGGVLATAIRPDGSITAVPLKLQ